MISVVRGWDDKEGPIEPKSKAGRRRVFLLDMLRPHLEPLLVDRASDELVFGNAHETPFDPRALARRIRRARSAADAKRAAQELPALERFTLHEGRHPFATWLDHAGVSADRADRYMGHSSGGVASRYRHLLSAQMAEEAAKRKNR